VRRVRVLHVIHSLSGGGAETQLCLLCNHWQDPVTKPAIFCVNPASPILEEKKVDIFQASTTKTYSPQFLRNFSAVLREVKPDIVHAWLPASVTIPCMTLARASGAKVVFSYRNRMYFHRGLSYPEFLVALACADRIASNHVPVDSHPVFKAMFRRKSGVVIRNAVSIPPDTSWHGIEQAATTVRFLFVGRLAPQKNCVKILEAAGILRSRCAEGWRLDIFGRGELEPELRSLAGQLNLDKHIHFRGYCDSVYEEMAEATMLLLPSIKEGMPNVLLEAMAIGLPAIASDIPPIQQLVTDEDTVLWIDPTSADDLAEKMHDVVKGRVALNHMSEKGKLLAQRYSPDALAREYEEFYSALAKP